MKQKEINNQKTIIVKKERFFKLSVSLKTILFIILFCFLYFGIWYVLKYRYLVIYLNDESNKYESLLFSIIVSMTLLMFCLSCGFGISYTNPYIKIIAIILIVIIVYYGYINYGLGLEFRKNFGLLYHTFYESNSKHGLLFFINNWLFWSFIYIVSLIFMSRD